MVGGGGVARLDISSGLPRCSRPLIENILVYLGMRIWGERVEERTGGNRVHKQGLCQGATAVAEVSPIWEPRVLLGVVGGGRDLGFSSSSVAAPNLG